MNESINLEVWFVKYDFKNLQNNLYTLNNWAPETQLNILLWASI